MTEELIINTACFVGGGIVGLIIGVLLERKKHKGVGDSILDDKALRSIIAYVILIVWTISALISAFVPDRHTPFELYLLMGGVFGILLNKGNNPILDSIIKRVTVNGDTKSASDNKTVGEND